MLNPIPVQIGEANQKSCQQIPPSLSSRQILASLSRCPVTLATGYSFIAYYFQVSMSKPRYTSDSFDRPIRWIVEYFPLNVSYNFFIAIYINNPGQRVWATLSEINFLAQYIIFHRIMKKQRKTRASKQKKQEPEPKTKPVAKSKSKSDKKRVEKEEIEPAVKKEINVDYKAELNGKKYQVKIHKNYEVDSESQIGKKIVNWLALLTKKENLKSGKLWDITQYSYYPTFQFELAGQKPEHEKCSICQFEYESLSMQAMQKQLEDHSNDDIIMLKCSHLMHFECLKQMVKDQDWVKCPVCSAIYGKMLGDQPPGTMTYVANKLLHCDGYPECGTIVINYNMFAGKRGNISFPGTHRVGYLPDNKEGNQVLELLKEAFERKLIFTIGRSVTTGRDNQIVWNGIHHKTNLEGGSAYFGYPDPTYFQRVKLQLAAKGVY